MARSPSGPGHQFSPAQVPAPHRSSTMSRTRSTTPGSTPRRGRNMWLVQSIEYAVGIGVGAASINSPDKLPLALVGAAIVVNATIVRAPLSAFRWSSPVVHRIAGLVIAVTASVVAFTVEMEVSTALVLAAAALAQGFLSVRFGHGI